MTEGYRLIMASNWNQTGGHAMWQSDSNRFSRLTDAGDDEHTPWTRVERRSTGGQGSHKKSVHRVPR